MVNDKPFIHLIKTPYDYYVFDVNTNNILKIDKLVYEILHRQQISASEDYEGLDNEAMQRIESMKNKGLLSSKRPLEIVNPNDEYFEYYLNNKLRMITLQITQQCNFRCSYCIYAEGSNEMQRKHSARKMTFEMAKRGIDFLIDHSRYSKTICVGFYGGEPLLEFDLIKKCIIYAEGAAEGRTLLFTITTNGTLLNSEIVEFFQEHRVSTLISLDGPKEIHDKHRRFASNGCGSFDTIEKNILKIKDHYPEYLDNISFSVVIDPQNDLSCTNSFFVNYELFKQTSFRVAIMDDTYSNEKVYYPEDFITASKYETFKAFLGYLKRIDKNSLSPLALDQISNLTVLDERFGKSISLPDKTSHAGPCIPGQTRLFLNVNGDLYPCERVSEVSDVMKIGNLDSGFDMKKARALLNIGSLTSEKCKNCWAINHCTACAKFADNIKEFSAELKSSHCKYIRQNVENTFRNYLALKEIKQFLNNRL
jgi:uncharacterized protein